MFEDSYPELNCMEEMIDLEICMACKKQATFQPTSLLARSLCLSLAWLNTLERLYSGKTSAAELRYLLLGDGIVQKLSPAFFTRVLHFAYKSKHSWESIFRSGIRLPHGETYAHMVPLFFFIFEIMPLIQQQDLYLPIFMVCHRCDAWLAHCHQRLLTLKKWKTLVAEPFHTSFEKIFNVQLNREDFSSVVLTHFDPLNLFHSFLYPKAHSFTRPPVIVNIDLHNLNKIQGLFEKINHYLIQKEDQKTMVCN